MNRRRDFDLRRGCAPIRGGKFTFRTLHAPDNRRGAHGEPQFTLDKRMTVTLPAIEGEEHKMVPCMSVHL